MALGQKSNYKILNLVGQGQFGRVYSAVELNSGNLVALKELRTKQLSTSNFLRELTFLVTLNHFNIVTCQALEHRDRQRYLVMDYCEGRTLRNLMDDRDKLPLDLVVKLVIDILQGLKYAHGRGIIHRDIKPENILLKSCDRGYTAHIADFGIAKLSEEIDSQETVGNTGSPAYMAPEQFYGEYSYNCDLYGVGVILYELIIGDRPFQGMPKELLPAHLSQAVSIPTNLPLILRRVITKSLQKLPQRRFQTAEEMLEALELMQAALESESRTDRRLKLDCSTLVPNLLPISQSTLSCPVFHLAFASDRVYLGAGDCLFQKNWKNGSLSTEATEKKLDRTVRSLQQDSHGCSIATSSSLYYLPSDCDLEKFHPLLNFSGNNLTLAIDPQRTWLGVAYDKQESEKRLEIYSLPDCRLQHSLTNDKSWQSLIALDRRHILGIHQNSKQKTEFHLLNRRGHWLANFTVDIRLDKLIYNTQYPNRLLATEVNNPNEVILITLEKFNLNRIPVKVEPEFIEPCQQGYILNDRHGKMLLISHFGDCLAMFQAPLASDERVTAIAVTQSMLLLASTSELTSQLHTFDWDCSI